MPIATKTTMMECNTISVIATYKTTPFNEVIYAAQLLLPLSAVYYTEPTKSTNMAEISSFVTLKSLT